MRINRKKLGLALTWVMLAALLFSVFGAVPSQAADPTTIASSTMVFQGTLTNDGDGSYTGTIAMIDENGTSFGDGVSGFDVYARNGAQATYDKAGSGSQDYACGAVTDHDAYTTGGGWGSQYNPDCADWYNYQLRLDGDNWYLEYNANVGNDGILTGASAPPMSGTLDWVTGYASETNAGAYYTGEGPAESSGYALNNTCTGTNDGTAAWDMDWSWGSEYVPLELAGFKVEITAITGGYRVILTPAPNEVWVDDDYDSSTPGWGVTHFDNIQDGIDAVEGSTVNVADGTYTITAAITVDKGVTITGNTGSPSSVLVTYAAAQSTHNGFEIGAANITIQGIKVKNCAYGFRFQRGDTGYTGCTITHCAVETAGLSGIGEIEAPNTTISYNTITDCGDKGIYVRKCESASETTRTEIVGNTLSDCSSGAIQTFGSKYVYIYNNTINATEDKGINIIRSNATGTADRIQVIGNTISETKWPGIQVIGAPYTYVYNNTLTKCNYHGGDGTGDWDYASIHVQDDGATAGGNVTVDNNTISDGINGVQIWSDDCTVTDNTIYNMGLTYADTKGTAGVGDGVFYNSGIIIGTNWLTNNNKPTGTTITGNSIYDNYWGLYVRDYATLSLGDPITLSVTAEYNWWGDASGPSGEGAGSGDAVSTYVDYDPWWANGAMTYPGYEVLSSDSSEVQAALDAAGLAGGGVVILRGGPYTPTGGFHIPAGVTLYGEDGNLITPQSPCFTLDGNGAGAVNLTCDGSSSPSDHGIVLTDTLSSFTDITIKDCEVYSFTDGIHLGKSSVSVTINGLLIQDNYIHDNTGDGIEFHNTALTSTGYLLEIRGNTLRDNSGVGINNNGSTFDGGSDIFAEYNEWGSQGGPNVGGGDGVSANVDYEPYVFGGIYVDLATQKVREDDDVTVYVKIDAASLYGVEFDMTFDHTLLQLKNEPTVGAFEAANSTCSITSKANANPTGQIEFYCHRADPDGEYTASGAALLTLEFTAQSIGTDLETADIDLDLGSVKFGAKPGVDVYVDRATDGDVVVIGSVKVEGAVNLQGRSDNKDATVDLSDPSSHGYDPSAVTSEDSGHYEFSQVWADTYTITIAMPRYLDVTATVTSTKYITATGDNVVVNELTLWGGDADDDDKIDISDATIIGNNYGTSGSGINADINDDKTVDILDLVLMGGNFTKESDTAYATWIP